MAAVAPPLPAPPDERVRPIADPQQRLDAIMRVIRNSYVMTVVVPEDLPPTDRSRALDVRSRTAAISIHAPRRLP